MTNHSQQGVTFLRLSVLYVLNSSYFPYFILKFIERSLKSLILYEVSHVVILDMSFSPGGWTWEKEDWRGFQFPGFYIWGQIQVAFLYLSSHWLHHSLSWQNQNKLLIHFFLHCTLSMSPKHWWVRSPEALPWDPFSSLLSLLVVVPSGCLFQVHLQNDPS